MVLTELVYALSWLGPLLGLILTATLEKPRQRIVSGWVTFLLVVFTSIPVLEAESRKATWYHMIAPTEKVLVELRELNGSGETEKANALLDHMIRNWDQVGKGKQAKSVREVRAEYQAPER